MVACPCTLDLVRWSLVAYRGDPDRVSRHLFGLPYHLLAETTPIAWPPPDLVQPGAAGMPTDRTKGKVTHGEHQGS